MTQFALAIKKDNCHNLISIEKQQDDFLLGVAKKLFPDSSMSEVFSLDLDGKNIDQLMLEAQKTTESSPFEKTELCQTIREIVPAIDELVLWYGSDYDDLDYVYDVCKRPVNTTF